MQIDLTNLPNVDERLVPVLSEYLEKLIECEESNGIDLKSGKLIKDIKEGKVVFLVKEEEAQGERSNWRNRGVNFCEVVVIDSKMVNDIEIVGHEIEHWFDGGLTDYPFLKEPINEICSAYIIYGDEETAKAQLRKKKDHPYYARVQFLLTLCEAANVTLEELLIAHKNDDIDFFYSLFPKGVQDLLAIDSLENIIFDKRLRGENNATVEVALLYDIIKELEAKIEPCYVSENDSGNQNDLWGIFQGYEEFLQEYTGYESVVQGRILRENCNLTPQAIGEITADIFPALQYCSREDILFQIYRKNAFLNPTSHNNASLSFLTGCLIMRREVEAAKNNMGEEGFYVFDEDIEYFLRGIIFCRNGNFNSGRLDFQNNIWEAKECEEQDGNITYQEFGRQVKFMLQALSCFNAAERHDDFDDEDYNDLEEEQTETYIRILCEIERNIEEVEWDMYEKEQDVEPDDELDDELDDGLEDELYGGLEDELYGGLDDGLCDNESKVIKDDKLLSTINALIVMYSITKKEAETWLGIVQETLQHREVGGKDGRS